MPRKIILNSEPSLHLRAFQAASTPMCITDGAGTVLEHNAVFAQLAGYPGISLREQGIDALFDKDLLQPWLNRSHRSRAGLHFPWPVSPQLGGNHDGHCLVDRIDAKGEKPAYLWSFGFPHRDSEFHAFCQSLLSLTQGTTMGMFMIDLEERVLFSNDICQKNGFFRHKPIPGENVQQAITQAAFDEFRTGLQIACEGQEYRSQLKLRFARKPQWFDLTFIPVHFSGKLKSVFINCREITSQKQLERDYQLSHQINAALAEKWPHAIVSIGEKGVLFANPAAERFLDAPVEEWRNGIQGALRENPTIFKLWQKLVNCLKGEVDSHHFEHTLSFSSRPKQIIDVYCHRSIVDNHPVLVSSWVDITELRQIQEDLARKAEELAILNKIAAQTIESLDLDTILDSTLKAVMKSVGANAGLIFMLDESEPYTVLCVKYHGFTKAETQRLTPNNVARSFTLRAVNENAVFFIEDVMSSDTFPPVKEVGLTSFVVIPIYGKNRALGTINLGRRGRGKLRILSEEALKSIGYQIGVAVENARLLRSRDQEIAERRKIELALRESEALYRQIIATSPEAVVLTSTEGQFLAVNSVFANMFGYKSVEEFMASGAKAYDFPSPSSKINLEKTMALLRKKERITNLQGLVRRRDGTLFTVEASASLIRDANHKPKAYLGLIRDITEQQAFEKALRESESRYRALAEAAHDMIYIIDRNDMVVYVNRFSALQFNMDPQAIIGKNRDQLFGTETSTHQEKNLNKVFKTGQPHYVEDVAYFPERTLYLGTWLVPLRDQHGRVDQVLGLSRDITELRENARKLEESEMRFRDIIERSLDGYYFVDREGVMRKVNRSFCDILRVEEERLIDKTVTEVAFPRHRTILKNIFSRVMSGKNIPYDELEIVPPNQKTIWISYNMRRVMKDGRVVGIEGFIRDITNHKLIQEALRISEARYQSLFDSIQFEVFALDLEGRFRESNLAFQRVWGNTVGLKVEDAILHAETARNIKEMIKRVKRQRDTVSASFQVKNNDHTVSYSAILSPVMTEGKNVIGFVGINVDISEQITTYERLRTLSLRLVQVQEEERRRIAREIHDSLGQYLTALQLEVTAAIRALDDRQQIPKALTDAHKTIEESISVASTLCYSLRPPLLDDFGLVAALKDYYITFAQKWNIEISFQTADIGTVLSKDGETALFRISQEALTNVLKHAQATLVKVRLECKEDQVILSIEDNGKGFNIEELQSRVSGTHFGLLTMKERVELLGGSLYVRSKHNNGTVITAGLPVIIGGS